MNFMEVKLKHINPEHKSEEFDSLRVDIESHINEIFGKLWKIIGDRVTLKWEQSKTKVDWETMISPDKLSRDYYINTIVVDVISMHNLLVKILSLDQLSRVFEQIFREM